ncbi:MAG: hypothetical protein IT210_11810 [Armatimonadetes bacterium]|nr:hypothetical protein [Armatimonadota bacterium]
MDGFLPSLLDIMKRFADNREVDVTRNGGTGLYYQDRREAIMPQYRYAYNQNEEIIDVFSLPQKGSEKAGPFICIACDQMLIAKTKGEKREKHFAHKVSLDCNEETYLHRLAKKTFYAVYTRCLEENTPYMGETRHCCSQPQSSPVTIRFHAAIGSSRGRRFVKSRSNQP